jgi:hypothetical protein
MSFDSRYDARGRVQWSERALCFGLAMASLGEIGLARDILTGRWAALPAHLAVFVDVIAGAGGLSLAWKLWHRSVGATYWLPVWCAGFAASWFMLFLADVRSVERNAIAPFAVGLVIWTAGTWWGARQMRRRFASEGSVKAAR